MCVEMEVSSWYSVLGIVYSLRVCLGRNCTGINLHIALLVCVCVVLLQIRENKGISFASGYFF